MVTKDTDVADDLKIKGLSEQLLAQIEELLEFEKEDMKEHLDTAKNNRNTGRQMISLRVKRPSLNSSNHIWCTISNL